MALITQIEKHVPLAGAIVVNCYCKVTELRGDKHCMHASMTATKDAPSGDLVDVTGIQFVPDLDGPNFIAQAYAHFKSMPEFAGATDC